MNRQTVVVIVLFLLSVSAGIYLDGPKDESGALVTAGFNYRF